MNSDDLKYRLIQGLDIPYMGIKVKQPTIQDVNNIGIISYLTMSYIFRIQKEHLQSYEEIKDKLNGKSIFESILIQEEILTTREDFNIKDSMIMLLVQSLSFFLNIKDFNRFEVVNDGVIIHDFKEINEQIYKIPIFKIDNSNFDEFSELIRLITCNDMLQVEKEEKLKTIQYADPSVQKIYEDLIKQHLKNEKEKKKENQLTISDVIGAICINENTKYNYKNIQELTIWQLFYQFNSMFSKENVEIVKSQFTSGNYNFEKVPDLDWLKKVKVKLPENTKIIKIND